MQGLASDKTFHLKWNNHLQNLSQLFTTIYSSSALADVTLSCRDGTLKAHKLVLSACSPYFEQIFKDNPCQHPIVILKGIPFSEINLLVEFMYKGSVDVQELDLQSLMHTASELEIRGLAYEARDNAAQMLNVNLEYPTSYPTPPVPITPVQPVSVQNFQSRTDIERLKQIHMYQQSMMRAEEMRRRRRDETQGSNTAVNNILAAAAREMEEVRNSRPVGINISAGVAAVQTEQSTDNVVNIEPKRDLEEKKRTSILTSEEERLKAKKKPQMTVRFQEEPKSEDTSKEVSPVPSTASSEATKNDHEMKGGIKVVQLAALQKPQNHDDDSDGGTVNKSNQMEEDEETDSSDSVSDTNTDSRENRPHVCDVCDLRFQRSSHLSRHRLTHTGERPFTCGGCGRSFARSDKLRVHNKICEREDPTVDLPSESNPQVKREKCEVMSGMVRSSHRESGHLVFTAGGDVTLPPRAQGREGDEPARRGRGRPRKTPLPLTPKVKKRRGRPPKTSLDMEGCVLTSGSMMGSSPQLLVNTPAGQQLLLKRKRGRPPKTYMMTRPDGRPNENYNATNLPFGDFSYLTDMMYLPTLQYFGNTSNDNSDRSMDIDQNKQRSIDLSDSSSDDEDNPKMEIEEHPTTVGRVMTVGDCQIVKLPSNDKQDVENDVGVPKTPSSVTITPITTVGDCTIRPVENNT